MAVGSVSPEKRVLGYSPPARAFLFLAVGAAFLAVICVLAQAYVLSQVVNRIFLQRQPPTNVFPLLTILLILVVARAVLSGGSEILAQKGAGRLKDSLRRDLIRHMRALGPTYTRGESSGELVHTAVETVETLDEYMTVYQPVVWLTRLAPASVLITVLVLDPLTTAVLLFTGPMLILLLALIGSRARDITERRFRELSWMSAFFLDMLQGMATLKMFGRSREQIENIRRISQRYGNTTLDVLRTAFQSALILEFGGTVATALVAVEISLRLMAGDLPFERALTVLIITPEFFVPLRQMAVRYHAGTAGKAAAERVFAILDTPVRGQAPSPAQGEGRDKNGYRQTSPLAFPSLLEAERGPRLDIHFHDVSYAYEDGKRPALSGFSLHIAHGEKVALVGPTGAGKTTVAHLLLRFIEPDAGAITVDGTPLAAVAPSIWRRHVAWVPQFPYLFTGTVAENIRLARQAADMADIVAAAKAAHAHEFILALPHGYETPIGERGARLSGGQRQRLALARAFLKDAPFLILDEATSHLDAESESAIQDAIARLLGGRTVLIIAHRLRLAITADRVAVMEQGRVVEVGAPRRLLAQDGPYRRLVAAYEDGAP